MADHAPGDKLVIDKAFIGRVKELGGSVLDFTHLRSDDDNQKLLRDEHVITIIDSHFKADEITYIDLDGCVGITNATLAHVAIKCTQLTHLSVRGCVEITDNGIKGIAEKIGTNLKILSYSLCDLCTDASLQAVVQYCPNLEKLDVHGTGITLIPEAIGYKLPKLSTLELQNNRIKTIPPSIALLRESLKCFDIDDNPIKDPPVEITKQGNNAIFGYLMECFIQSQGFTLQNRTGGINDAAAQGSDRLGYRNYAKAIFTVAHAAEAPTVSVCGAYFTIGGGG